MTFASISIGKGLPNNYRYCLFFIESSLQVNLIFDGNYKCKIIVHCTLYITRVNEILVIIPVVEMIDIQDIEAYISSNLQDIQYGICDDTV